MSKEYSCRETGCALNASLHVTTKPVTLMNLPETFLRDYSIDPQKKYDERHRGSTESRAKSFFHSILLLPVFTLHVDLLQSSAKKPLLSLGIVKN
jgi:hypothetical protein